MNYTKEQMRVAIERAYADGVEATHLSQSEGLQTFEAEDYLPKEEPQITKWEYSGIGEGDVEDMDQEGEEGWELVTISGGVVYFKRPLIK